MRPIRALRTSLIVLVCWWAALVAGGAEETATDDLGGSEVALPHRTGRQAGDGLYEVEISFPAQSGLVTDPNTNEETDIQQLIQSIILNDSGFDVQSQLPNVVPDPSSLVLGSEYFCPPGKVVVGSKCVPCALGTFYSNDTGTCQKCPVGAYQDTLGQLTCVTCPEIAGRPGVTAHRGANSLEMCKERCLAGQYFDSELRVCRRCGFGSYQPSGGQFTCLPCGPGLTTRSAESTDAKECREECADGRQFSADGSCQACPVGTYRTRGVQRECVTCPEGTTTEGTGSTVVNNCTLPVCQPGTYLKTTGAGEGEGVGGNVTCSPCPLGTYQPGSQRAACIECPPDTTTKQVGAVSQRQCENPCDTTGGQPRCSRHAVCLISFETNTHRCECRPGFRGDGVNCTDRCETFCLNSGTCSKDRRTGLPRCACIGSFTGERCEEKSSFAYIAGGAAGVVIAAIICVLFIWMICARASRKKHPDSIEKALTIQPDLASQMNLYYGAPTPYAESIAPSHHSAYAHYYPEEEDAWDMPNFYTESYMKDGLHPARANSLARSTNASMYAAYRPADELYDRLRKHAYMGKKDTDTTDESDDQLH